MAYFKRWLFGFIIIASVSTLSSAESLSLPAKEKTLASASSIDKPKQAVSENTKGSDKNPPQPSAPETIIKKDKPIIDSNTAPKPTTAKTSSANGRISLNFQDIKVRNVLEIIGEFTGLNVVVSDGVQGNITLRLDNIPWQQALDVVLRAQGLTKRQVDNVLMIAPLTEMAARDKAALDVQQQTDDLAPLQSDLININYAKAADIAALLKGQGNNLLSTRGNVSADIRSNAIWVQDTPQKLKEIRNIVARLDKPAKQVLIEARIVNINSDFEKDLGVKFGLTEPKHLSGTLTGANQIATGTTVGGVAVTDRLNIDLPAVNSNNISSANVGLALAKLGSNVLLDLELSALESEGSAKIISSPRLITANQQAATIEQGEEIPYQENTSSGATSTAFKKAVLLLKVTPQITPDGKIIMALKVTQDKRSTQPEVNNVPAIDTQEIETQIIANNGETIVLGGVYVQDKSNRVNRVPFLGSIPGVGALFRNTQVKNDRKELLIFVTPKIIQTTEAINS